MELLNTAVLHADGKPLDLEKAAAQAGLVFSGVNTRERTKCSPTLWATEPPKKLL